MTILSIPARPVDVPARCARCLLWVALAVSGCATQEPDAPAPVVESAQPNWSEPAPQPVPVLSTASQSQATPRPAFSRAQPEELELALTTHREALLASESRSLPEDEAGYYLDTLEARLIQLLRNSGVRYQRDGNRFEMQFASGDSFAVNTARLTETASEQLRPVVNVLVEYDRTRILVYGHTDDIGEADYNRALSSRRAEAVANLLIDGGVEPRRILVAGFGEDRPVAENTSDAGRALNRRVELVVEPLVRTGRG